MKKIIALLLIISIAFLGCCGEDLTNWNIKDFSVEVRAVSNQILINNEVTADSTKLFVPLEQEFVYYESPFKNPFISSAFALSCPEQGRDGMSNRIKELVITSSEDFGGIVKGESLNDIILVEVGGSNFTIDEWVSNTGTLDAGFNSTFVFLVTERPASDTKHVFTVKMVMLSGDEIEKESQEILWK